jgi:hypothetical protein
MGDFRVEGGELKKIIKAAKKGPVAFGFNPGKSEEEAYLAMHRKKAATIVGKDAREGGEGGKFAFGTATVSGKVITLTCLRELPGLAKRMKKHLKSRKVMLNVAVLDADGNQIESDIEDDLPDDPELEGPELDGPELEGDDGGDADDDGAQGAAGAGPGTTPAPAPPPTPSPPEARPGGEEIKQLATELAALRKEIEAAGLSGSDAPVKAFAQLVAALRAGEVEKVAAGIDRIRGALSKIPKPPPPPGGDAALALKVADALDRQVAGLGDATLRGRLQQAMEQIRKIIAAGDAGKALAAMKKLRETLAAAGAGGAPKPRLSEAPLRGFLDARDTGVTQIARLQDALRATGHPALKELADKGFAGITGRLQVGLQVALMDVDAAAPADRPKAVARAVETVEAFQAMLATDPTIALLEDNPFGIAVTLRRDIGAALDTIRQGLDA